MFKWFKKLFKSNPKKKGRRLAMGAMLAFHAPQDADKFRKVRNQLVPMVSNRTVVSYEMISKFQKELAEELKVNPILFSMVFAELLTYVDPVEPEGTEEFFLFLEGVIDAIDIVYPSF